MFKIARVAPIEPEKLCEHPSVFRSVDETGVQRPVKIPPFGEAYRLNGADRVDDPTWPDGQPGPPQRACEMHDIGGEARVFRQLERNIFGHQRTTCPPRVWGHVGIGYL